MKCCRLAPAAARASFQNCGGDARGIKVVCVRVKSNATFSSRSSLRSPPLQSRCLWQPTDPLCPPRHCAVFVAAAMKREISWIEILIVTKVSALFQAMGRLGCCLFKRHGSSYSSSGLTSSQPLPHKHHANKHHVLAYAVQQRNRDSELDMNECWRGRH